MKTYLSLCRGSRGMEAVVLDHDLELASVHPTLVVDVASPRFLGHREIAVNRRGTGQGRGDADDDLRVGDSGRPGLGARRERKRRAREDESRDTKEPEHLSGGIR